MYAIIATGGKQYKVSEGDVIKVESIYTLVVREYDEELSAKLKKLGASLIEPVDVSLEEMFVILEEARERKEGED